MSKDETITKGLRDWVDAHRPERGVLWCLGDSTIPEILALCDGIDAKADVSGHCPKSDGTCPDGNGTCPDGVTAEHRGHTGDLLREFAARSARVQTMGELNALAEEYALKVKEAR